MAGRYGRWQPQAPLPVKRKGLRPGMLVRCPWCDRSGVTVTRQGLIEHTEGELDGGPRCEGSGQRIALGPHGKIIKESDK